MAEHPMLPFWTDAYLADTNHLTTIEHGTYLLLLIAMWRSKGSLPDDDEKLARFAKLTKTQWARMKPTIMEFFDSQDGQITQGRLTDEYEAVRQHSRKQSDRAKARWLKTKKPGMPPHESGIAPAYASPSPTPSPTKEERANALSKKKPTSRGTRLPEDWTLPKAWGEWAVSEGWPVAVIRDQSNRFRDYWISAPGQKGVKLDWLATWRNWMRNSNAPKQINGGNANGQTSSRSDRLHGVITAAAAGTSGKDWG